LVSETLAALLASQFSRFLAAGGVAAAANFGSRFLFSEFMAFESAVIYAFLVGLISGFLLSRTYVFKRSSNGLRKEIALYSLVNLVALVQTWLLSVYGASYLEPRIGLELGQATAHMAGIMLPVITSYFGHKYLTFREQ
jgi:putative flippase GtrA